MVSAHCRVYTKAGPVRFPENSISRDRGCVRPQCEWGLTHMTVKAVLAATEGNTVLQQAITELKDDEWSSGIHEAPAEERRAPPALKKE